MIKLENSNTTLKIDELSANKSKCYTDYTQQLTLN